MSTRAMAEAADGTLGDLIELTTNYPDNPNYDRRRFNFEEALSLRTGIVKVSSTSIVPKKVGVRISVLGRWVFIGPEIEASGKE